MRRLVLGRTPGRWTPALTSALVSGRRGASARVLGVDPGTLRVGWAVLERSERGPVSLLDAGVIRLRGSDPIEIRLLAVHQALAAQLARWKPGTLALESAFFGRSVPAAIRLGEGRGAALVAAAAAGVPVRSWAPAQVKKAVSGHGAATKATLQAITRSALGLEKALPTDASDAAAVALCHLMRS